MNDRRPLARIHVALLALFLIFCGVGGSAVRAETAQSRLRVKMTLVVTEFADQNDSFTRGVRINGKDIIQMVRWQNPADSILLGTLTAGREKIVPPLPDLPAQQQ